MSLWPFGKKESEELSPEERTALAAIVRNAKFELIPLKGVQDQVALLPPKSTVTVTASPTKGMGVTIELAESIAAQGHDVIPHFSARLMKDRAELKELIARAKAAGMRKLFVVGGDGEPSGEFKDGLDLLRALQEVGHHFEEVGVPSYPEGHAQIADDVLMRVLKEKNQYSNATATQMSFNPGAVAEWIGKIRSEGVTLPIYLGVAGVVELTKLMTIAARIGVADSARYLSKQAHLVGRLAAQGSFGPDAFLRTLAPTAVDPASKIHGLHVFTFNQVGNTAAWQKRMLEELAG
jgi:methylenetetrahydrofolate reductase (NADPH)